MKNNWYEEQLEKCRREFKKTTDKMLDEWFSLTHEHIMKNYGAQSSTKGTDDVRERITAFRQKDMPDVIYYKTQNGLFSFHNTNDGSFDFKDFSAPPHEIYSALNGVGEEFKIDDVVRSKVPIKDGDSCEIRHYGAIRAFKITDRLCAEFNEGGADIDILTKAEEKKVLFTIEGKELFAGDKVWNVLDFEAMEITLEPRDALNMFPSSPNFLTKEAAEKWIARNKKSISYQDILDICKEHFEGFNESNASAYGIGVVHLVERFKPKNTATKQ